MPKVVLKEVKSWRDWLPLRNLQVKPEQRKYKTNVVISYLQATHPAVTGYGIYVEENLIGYVFLIHAENPVQWIIDRLIIDKQYQRQGYGNDVVDQLIDMVYDFENSEMVIARYDPDNEAARQLFVKWKFEEQDRIVRGRNIATLEFEFEEIEVDEEDDLEDEDDNDEEDNLDEDEYDDDEYEDDDEEDLDDEEGEDIDRDDLWHNDEEDNLDVDEYDDEGDNLDDDDEWDDDDEDNEWDEDEDDEEDLDDDKVK